MIILVILSVLAAIVIPEFQNNSQLAKETAAKTNLKILREAIERYAAEHSDVAPGYRDNDPTRTPKVLVFGNQLTALEYYLSELPENPFNDILSLNMIDNGTPMPTEPANTDVYGWVYKASTKTIKLNWPGTDSKGVAYFDY